MEKKSHLLENIAGRIMDSLYNEMDGIKKVTVKVSKINRPCRENRLGECYNGNEFADRLHLFFILVFSFGY